MCKLKILILLFSERALLTFHGINLIQACNFTKTNTPPWVFLRFLNCANGTESHNAPYIWLSDIFMTHAKKSTNIILITKRFSNVCLSILHTLPHVARVKILVSEPNSS